MTPLPLVLAFAALLPAAIAHAAPAAPSRALADTAWTACGAPVSTGAQDRSALVTLPDGQGGIFILWQGVPPGGLTSNLFSHHLDMDGAPAAGWVGGGRALCTEAGAQSGQVAIPDAAGGFLAVWTDDRADSAGGSDPDIYALRVTATGGDAAGWIAGGTRLSGSRRPQRQPAIAPDGAGGSFVAWEQPAAGSPTDDEIVLQRVLGDGSLAPGWPDSGIVIAGGAGGRGSPTVVTDAAGGCIVAWYDARGINNDIYAQRVTAAGSAMWTANGVLARGGTSEQVTPRGVPDGAGGVVLAILDLISGQFTSLDILAQRLDSSGSPVAGWTTAGVPVCRAGSAQVNHLIVGDGAGGAFIAWDDYRSGQSRSYAQHVLASGAIAAGWAADGNPVTGAAGDNYETHLAADGTGGALVGWTAADLTVAVQRLAANGAPAAGWPADGVTLCTEFQQFTPSVAPDGSGGLMAVRFDSRSGSFSEIYASHVTFDALVPTLLATAGAEVSADRVKLRWFGAEPGTVFELSRRSEGVTGWTLLDRLVADGSRFLAYEDTGVRPGDRLRYRLSDPSGEFTAAEVAVEIPLAAALAFEAVTPNPSAGEFVVRFASPGAAVARIEVIDVTGRLVAAREARVTGGAQRIAVGRGAGFAPGIYAVRLRVGGWSETRTVCVVR